METFLWQHWRSAQAINSDWSTTILYDMYIAWLTYLAVLIMIHQFSWAAMSVLSCNCDTSERRSQTAVRRVPELSWCQQLHTPPVILPLASSVHAHHTLRITTWNHKMWMSVYCSKVSKYRSNYIINVTILICTSVISWVNGQDQEKLVPDSCRAETGLPTSNSPGSETGKVSFLMFQINGLLKWIRWSHHWMSQWLRRSAKWSTLIWILVFSQSWWPFTTYWRCDLNGFKGHKNYTCVSQLCGVYLIVGILDHLHGSFLDELASVSEH